MKPDLDEISEVSQALDYLAEQNYSEDEKLLLIKLFDEKNYDVDLDQLKDNFPGKRGVISRLRIIFNYASRHKKETELMEDLANEINFLVSDIAGENNGTLEF